MSARRPRASASSASDTYLYSTPSSLRCASSGGSFTAREAPCRFERATSASSRRFVDLLELGLRRRLVDEPPLDGALAAHALGDGGERVGEVAADLALVDEAREAAGAGEHGEERRLGQAHRARAVVGEDDLVARDRELVAAAATRCRSARARLGMPLSALISSR